MRYLLIPFDSESSYAGLVCQDVPAHFVHDRFGWRVIDECLVCIFIVDIIADANKFAIIVSTR